MPHNRVILDLKEPINSEPSALVGDAWGDDRSKAA